MVKRVVIIHGWGGSPKEPMLQWLKAKIEERGLKAISPVMPDTDNPIIEDWVKKIEEVVGDPDKDTVLVGHSIGCQTILRYLEKLHPTKRIGSIFLIAPWFILSNLENDKERKIAKPWIDIPIKDTDVVKHTSRIVAIFSDNDPLVPKNNIELFKKRLGATIILEHKKGHFDGVKNLPSVLKAILEDK